MAERKRHTVDGPGFCEICSTVVSRYASRCVSHSIRGNGRGAGKKPSTVDPKWLVRGLVSNTGHGDCFGNL